MAERAAKQLELNKSELPNSITEVIATLSRAGFDAYIVGGGVRDTLLGLKPKDFDAVTDAKPHEIKDVFGKRCRIIGRRFQLAHVYSGRELIEVATFRGPPNNTANTNQDGMIIRDNVWGDIKQDFARRDFSINALYYQPLKGIVHDFCGALNDIDNKIIRLLGNAPVRIEEDPVRLLRALRFKAKLGFEFDDELAAQFNEDNWALLEQISPHRLYDETQKMFTGGYLVPLLPLLFESGAIDSLIIYPPSEPNALVTQVAFNTDKRINAGKSINPAFFYAALLWENYLHQLEKAKKRNMPFAEAQMQAAGKVIERQRIKTAIPKFAEQFIRDIWILQPKLAAPRSKQIEQLSEHPRFRAGFDFLLLREQCGDAEHPLSESTNEMGEWWQTYQTLSEKQKQKAIDDFDENIRRGAYKQGKNGQRGRNRNRQSQSNTSNEQDNSLNSDVKVTKSTQITEATHSKQPVVNDASNVPTRRRRRANDIALAEAKATSDSKVQNRNNSKSANKLTPRERHDSNELAQLQQLSLANSMENLSSTSKSHQSNSNQHSTPAPLFVIEHESVVPPLQKQIDGKVEQAEPNKTPATDNKVVDNKEIVKKAPKQKNQQQTASAAKIDDSASQQKNSTKSTKVEPSEVNQPSVTKAKVPRAVAKPQIARSPQLVSINDEPVPAKRRRRQPSIELPVATADKSAATKYEKKVPKAAAPKDNTDSKAKTTKSVTSTKSKSAKASKKSETATDKKMTGKVSKKESEAKVEINSHAVSNNPGPVPSKRRRRQPSTDTVATEQVADNKSTENNV